jgi:2-oxoisovalerate dehydrogenase E1 component
MRSQNPTIFFEHRHLLDATWSRRPYPGDSYVVPFGKARIIQPGQRLTVVTWGAMVERVELAAVQFPGDVEILDLRTMSPWDKEGVLASVGKTRRLLVVHEDGLTAGFGAEVVAYVTQRNFFQLDAPPQRVAVEDIPIAYNVNLMEASLPSVEHLARTIQDLLET